MNIGFTGHRDKNADIKDISQIATKYAGATWLHGGAKGFDTQVDVFARVHSIPAQVYLPDYEKYGRGAPLVRDREIVDNCDMLVALYDGRKTGGTAYTVNYAIKKHKPILYLLVDEDEDA